MIDEQLRLESRIQLLEQPVRHRSAGKAQLSDARNIRRGELAVMDEVMIKRRHEIEIGNFFRLDDGERFAGVVARKTNESATNQGHRDQGSYPHRVIQRHHPKRPLAAAIEVLRNMSNRGGALGTMATRY